AQRLFAGHPDPDRDFFHRSTWPEHSGRLYRTDFDRPRGVLFVRRIHLRLYLEHLASPGILRDSPGGRRHGHGRSDLRRAGSKAQGPLSRHRDAGGAIYPARLLLARRLVLRRLGAGQRQSILDFRLHLARRPAIFLRGAGLCAGELPFGDQFDAHARWPRAGGDPRPLPLRGNHGHQFDEIPHAVVRAGGVLCRDRRRALCALSTGGLQRRLRHRTLHPVSGHGHHRWYRLDHGHIDGHRLRGGFTRIDGVDQRQPERQRDRPGAVAQQQHHISARDLDRADHYRIPDVRAGWARASLAADQDVLETLPVFTLRLRRDQLQSISTDKNGGNPMTIKSLLSSVSLALLLSGAAVTAKAQIAIGQLADYSGGTSDVGTPYGQGVADAFAWVNKNGGIGGKPVSVDTVDYGYQVPKAVALYKKWSSPDNKVAAIMGWGTADTEALTGFVTQDKIPDISGSYAAALSDPTGVSGKAKAAPYNFFYGPTYSDALRAELTWAAEDWKAKGKPGKPKFVHMGANHPYPNAPKAAGEALAAELGFEVLPPLVFALSPGDYSAQCLSLKSAGANYAYLGNTAASNISVMKACKTAGVDVQFLSNVWGMDENAAKTAGDA